jgi:hypothetical protein
MANDVAQLGISPISAPRMVLKMDLLKTGFRSNAFDPVDREAI